MAFLRPQLQILSDLHLETPISNPQYANYRLKIAGSALLLLGDIGLVEDKGLFTFLRRLLDENRGCRVFYILGNHEAYRTTLDNAVRLLRQFEGEARQEYGGRFRFLFRDRFDVTDRTTILGCTLWSNIQPEHAIEIQNRLTDFNEERGITSWTVEASREEHARDLAWLNAEVDKIQTHEPHREIIIATHHCPSSDARATAPAHQESSMNSAFVSNLSNELCWTSSAVKVWAFGHTHYSCAFRDAETAKLVVSNQQGYNGIGASKSRRAKMTIIEPQEREWQVAHVDIEAPKQEQKEQWNSPSRRRSDVERNMGAQASSATWKMWRSGRNRI